jgi:hypothetical protein
MSVNAVGSVDDDEVHPMSVSCFAWLSRMASMYASGLMPPISDGHESMVGREHAECVLRRVGLLVEITSTAR